MLSGPGAEQALGCRASPPWPQAQPHLPQSRVFVWQWGGVPQAPPCELNHAAAQEGNGIDKLFPPLFLRIFLLYSEDRITVCKHLKVIRACSLSGADASNCSVPTPRAGDVSCADEQL